MKIYPVVLKFFHVDWLTDWLTEKLSKLDRCSTGLQMYKRLVDKLQTWQPMQITVSYCASLLSNKQ
jgi:hypothetical protein